MDASVPPDPGAGRPPGRSRATAVGLVVGGMHAGAMTLCATGAAFDVLAVAIVDAPTIVPLRAMGLPDGLTLWSGIALASVLYGALAAGCVRVLWGRPRGVRSGG